MLLKNSKHTKKVAADLAHKILKKHAQAKKARLNSPSSARRATVVGLVGDLGAGKTTFVQGFAQALGITHRVPSPTFLIMRRYPIPNHQPLITNHAFLVHMDAYRIKHLKELVPLNFKKLLADPENIILIEWADLIKKALPKNTLWIHFTHGKDARERTIDILD